MIISSPQLDLLWNVNLPSDCLATSSQKNWFHLIGIPPNSVLSPPFWLQYYPKTPYLSTLPSRPSLLALSDSGSRGRCDACHAGAFYKCGEIEFAKCGVEASGTEPFQRDCDPDTSEPFLGLLSPILPPFYLRQWVRLKWMVESIEKWGKVNLSVWLLSSEHPSSNPGLFL